ncbi:phosphatidylcholine-sterol acyltransferase, putative [Plasmodium relictum]|uniref:Phospholipase, putative n=1 Tax=Plasmodium relictum TaxID=85471 RepID=A0A1J1H848_PLARL|nr:phosphatidylcholine-sterol acyltransferase, putative [Plasmodium relictum]CRH00844.1 phosphatidylcholine-sterol acyltransferase, putative [Plasmodium relictum]
MSTLFYLFILYNFLHCSLVLTKNSSLDEFASFLLRGPYRLTFGDSYTTGEVFDENDEENHPLYSKENEGKIKKVKGEEIDEVDRETGEMNRETGEVDRETGEVNRETGEVDRETGEVNRETGEVDRETGEVNRETGEVDRETGEVNRETGEVDRETGEVNRETGEVDRETGEVNRETGEVDRETGEVNRETGEVDRETGEVDREIGELYNEEFELDNFKREKQALLKKNSVQKEEQQHDKMKGYIKWTREETKKDNDKKNYIEIYNPTTYLIPGVGGSTLIAEYKNAQINSCGKNVLNSKPFRIWLSLSRLFSIKSNLYCTFDTLRLIYDEKKNSYINQKGVNIRVESYGSLKGVDYLDYFNNNGIGLTKYYNVISSHFISNGYINGESIIGAPYDWRYPLYQQKYDILKAHIEYNYEMRNKKKVNLIGHSFGGLFINFFLSRVVDDEWKDKYLNSVIYINSPFKGSFKTIRALLHGNRDFISFSISKIVKLSISEGMMKAIGNSIGSLFDLIPYREYFEHDQIVILMNLDDNPIDNEKIQSLVKSCGLYDPECYTNRTDVKLRVYTLSNWHNLLSPELKMRYENHLIYTDRNFSMDHGVPIFCIYSTTKKKSTEHLLFFQSPDLSKEPFIYYGEGDGTVPLESLESCSNFANTEVKYFKEIDHSGVLRSNDVAKYIYSKAHIIYD